MNRVDLFHLAPARPIVHAIMRAADYGMRS